MNRYNKKDRNYKGKKYNKGGRRNDGPRPVKLRGLVVTPYENESADHMIKRFKRLVDNSGIMRELKKREYHLSPSQKRREKKKRALKRLRKRGNGYGEND